LHGGLDPSWQTTVVPLCGTTTVVFFAGGGGLLLLMHPDNTDTNRHNPHSVFIATPH
jgi:hypothetical protein